MNQQHHKDYFQGVLQLRNPSEESINFVDNEIRKRDDVFVAKAEEVTNGMDYYLSSNKFLKALGKKIQKQFGGDLKFSARLFTKSRQTSKELYRVSVLVRLPSHKVGEIVKYRGEKIKILQIGKKIFGKYLDTGKKVTLKHDDLK